MCLALFVPLRSSHGSPISRPPCQCEEIREEIDSRYLLCTKCPMICSCTPAVLTFFGHTHEVAFEFWPPFRSRGASVLLSASYVGFQEIVFGVQHQSRWILPAFGHQPWMTTSQSTNRENGCVEQVIRRTVGFSDWLRDAYKVHRSRPSESSPRAG